MVDAAGVFLSSVSTIPAEALGSRDRPIYSGQSNRPPVDRSFGYGLGITDINGFLGHDGAIAGYGTAMFYLPRRKATIVLIGNNNDLGNPTPLAPAFAIAAYLFPKQFPNGL